MNSLSRRNLKDFDYTLLISMVLISIMSCIAVYTSTYGKANPATGSTLLGIPSHILIRQIVYEGISYVAIISMALFDYSDLAKWSKWMYGFTLLLLLAVYGFHQVNGARSWIPFPLFSFQPSELAKLVLIIWIANYMARMNQREHPDYTLRGLWPIFVAFIIPFALIYKEPALGQSLVLVAIVYTMLLAYMKKKQFVILLSISLVFGICYVLLITILPTQTTHFLQHQHLLSKYQSNRLISFINPNFNPSSSGYQVIQAQIAVGSGGLFGTGILKGSQTLLGFVPYQWTDFIFSDIAEQLGFIGSSVLIVLYLIVFYRLVRIATMIQDDFASYLLIGIVGMLAFQVFQNIGMNILLMPTTGITLPFMSFGGSSLIIDSLGIGIALSASTRRGAALRFD